jgi:hypothetical protein
MLAATAKLLQSSFPVSSETWGNETWSGSAGCSGSRTPPGLLDPRLSLSPPVQPLQSLLPHDWLAAAAELLQLSLTAPAELLQFSLPVVSSETWGKKDLERLCWLHRQQNRSRFP